MKAIPHASGTSHVLGSKLSDERLWTFPWFDPRSNLWRAETRLEEKCGMMIVEAKVARRLGQD